jgi:hypothetical protein
VLVLPPTTFDTLEEQGYVLIPKAFDPKPVREIVDAAVERHLRNDKRVQGGGYRPDILHVPEVQALMVEPSLLDLAWSILKCEPAFGSLGANVIPANSRGMEAHVDYPYFAMAKMPADPFPAYCVQLIWYLVDVSEDFAPTAVVPESHTVPRKPDADEFREKAVPIIAEAGDLVVSHGALWHAVMPNQTARDRPVVLGSYVPYWVRPMLRPDVPFGASSAFQKLMCSDFGERIGEGYSRNSVKV